MQNQSYEKYKGTTHVNTVNVKNLYKYVNICTQKLSLQNRKVIHKKICMKTFKQC